MKIRITKDTDYRHSPAVIQVFRAETEVNVPKKVATELIERGAAKAIKPAAEAETSTAPQKE